MDKRQTVTFRTLAEPNTQDWLLYRVPKDGTVEEIRIKFYAGPEHSLEIEPFIERKQGKVPDFLIESNDGKHFVTGDNDYFIYPITYIVEQNDYIKVRYKNNDLNYAYHVVCDIIVDFVGGKGTVR